MFATRDASADVETLSWQPNLFEVVAPHDRGVVRHQLDRDSWVDHGVAWLAGADAVFDHLLSTLAWEQREMAMYEQVVWQPRLSAGASEADVPAALRAGLLEVADRYGLVFERYFVNLYRNGGDSVAWHSDRIGEIAHEPLVVIVSLGATRTFALRPKGGGPGRRLTVGHGDLVVMGGRCQHDWEHSVPKTAAAVGPRISFTARHLADGA